MSQSSKQEIQKQANTRRVILWAAVSIVLIGIVFLVVRVAKNQPSNTSQSSLEAKPIDENDWVKGNKDAKVTLIEYSDFQCPACGSYYPLIKKVAYEMGGRIQLAYRNYPLTKLHPNAASAARAAGAAGKQGKFWEMHDVLFEEQSKWSEEKDVRPVFIEYAKKIKLNMEQFLKDIDSSEVQKKIDEDVRSGDEVHIPGTPTFFLNGKHIANPQGFEEFKKIIDEATQ